MPSSTPAVFLSYASQDATAARRIAAALRDAGIEVWFDEAELAGGDAWDRKIKQQIRECALFLPIISANTQARTEGYFRLEWRLAEQRTFLMAKGRPFLLPIVVDDTPDVGAHVPDSFLEVQWSRFPDGRCDATFAERVNQLLAWDGASTSPGPAAPAERPTTAAKAAGRRSLWWLWFAIPGAISGLIYPLRGILSDLRPNDPPAAAATSVQDEADELAARGFALVNEDPLLTRRNLELAEQLAQRALAADPSNAEANALAAWINYTFVDINYEDTPQRRADLRRYAETAQLLDPTSVNVRLALAGLTDLTGQREAALAQLEALANDFPQNETVLRNWAWRAVWGSADNWRTSATSSLEPVRRLRALSESARTEALAMEASLYWDQGRYAEADSLLDSVFADGAPNRNAYLNRILILNYGWGDLDAAAAFAETIPPKLLLEDVFIRHLSALWTWRRDYDRALATLDRTQRPVLQEALISDPTDLVRGNILAAAGKSRAAREAWMKARSVIEARVEANPRNLQARMHMVSVLNQLGEERAAEEAFAYLQEVVDMRPGTWAWQESAGYFLLRGNFEEALDRLDASLDRSFGRWPNVFNGLRFDPLYDPLRPDPRFQALLQRGAGWMNELRAEAGKPPIQLNLPEATGEVHRETPAPPPRAVDAAPSDADARSLAVLAFANMSADAENAYFSDGISEELLNVLAKVTGLKVTARTSAFHFKGKDTPIPEIARQLGVAYVVEGSVRKAGDRVRITAQLIKADDGFHVWSDTFDRDLKDIFAVQDEIAGLIAQQLQLKLGVTKPDRVVDPEAYELVLKGRHFWSLRGEANLAIAEEAFRRALEIDPNFAEAHAGMADVWMIRAWYRTMDEGQGPAVAEDLERATAAVQRATELDPGLAEPYATLGAARFIQGRFDEVEAPFAKAFELNPNYAVAHHWYAVYCQAVGRYDVSMDEITLAVRLDPLAPIPLWTLASNLNIRASNFNDIGAANEAVDVADRGLQLRPGFLPLLAEKASAAWNSGRRDEAIAAARAIAADHSDAPRWTADADAVFVLRQSGHLDEAQQLAERVFTTVPDKDYRRAMTLAVLGRMDEALDLGADFPSTSLSFILTRPVWDPVREDPRFRSMLEEQGIYEIYRKGRATLERMRRQHNAGS